MNAALMLDGFLPPLPSEIGAAAVAEGDTFERVGKGSTIWEVTSNVNPNGLVRLDSDLGTIFTDIDALAIPTKWKRVRCP